MPRTLFRILVATSLLSLSTGAFAGGKGKGKDKGKDKGGNDGNPRNEWVKKFDHNNDGDWRGGLFGHKDTRKFKKAHEAQHSKLVNWCERAKEKPAKFGVKFPKGEKEKKFKCKKGKVDGPYLKAWVRDGKPEKEEKPAPTR